MSQLGRYVELNSVQTLTGNSGVATAVNQNINVIGDVVSITTSGSGDTLTITGNAAIPLAFVTDSGTATPAANSLNVVGDGVITTSGSGDTLTITFAAPITVPQGGTGATTLTDHGVLLGSGTSAVTVTTSGSNGQVFLGATGGDPAFGTLTSSNGSIVFTTGANSLGLTANIAAAGGVDGLIPDSGTSPVVPDASGDIDIIGGTNINTVGGTNALTINLDDAITLATSVTSPLYTAAAASDVVLNMLDDAGTYAVSFTNDSNMEVAYVDSLGIGSFNALNVDNININVNTISSTDTNGNIVLTPNGAGSVLISYLTQYTLPIAGALGALDDLADGLGSAGQVLTSNGAGNEPTWEDTAVAFTWNVATGSTQACAVNNGYFANYNGTLAFTLPTTAAVGDSIQICQMFAGQGWTLAVNTGETIYIGNTNTTITTGTLASTANGDWIELVCRVANTDWAANVKSGNITVT